MSTLTLERIFYLIFCIFALSQLIPMHKSYKHLRYITYPALGFVIHIIIFAVVLLVDGYKPTDFFEPAFYNEWSAFIRLQASSSLAYVAWKGLRELRKYHDTR